MTWIVYYASPHSTMSYFSNYLQMTAHPVSFCSNTPIANHEQRTFTDVLQRIFPHPLSRNKHPPQEAFIILLAQGWLVFFIRSICWVKTTLTQCVVLLWDTTTVIYSDFAIRLFPCYPGRLPDWRHNPVQHLNNHAGNHMSGRTSEVQNC